MNIVINNGNQNITLKCADLYIENPQHYGTSIWGDNYQLLSSGTNILQQLSPILNVGLNTFTTNFDGIRLTINKTKIDKNYGGAIKNGNISIPTGFVFDSYSYDIRLITQDNYLSAVVAIEKIPHGVGDYAPVNKNSIAQLGSSPVIACYTQKNENNYDVYMGLIRCNWENILECYNGNGTSKLNATGYIGAFSAQDSQDLFTLKSEYLFNASGRYLLRNNSNGQYFNTELPATTYPYQNFSYYMFNGSTILYVGQTDSTDNDNDENENPPDDGSDAILDEPAEFPLVSSLVTIYRVNPTLLQTIGKEIWSNNKLKDILNINGNAIDAIIGLKIYYYDITTNGDYDVIIGNVNFDVSAGLLNSNIGIVDCGSLSISKYYNNYLDNEPYTDIQIYLPYIGFKKLKANDVIGAQISIKYYIDILTGMCTANLYIRKTYNGINVNALLYQFTGNCDMSVPISSANNNNVLSGIISTAMGIYELNPIKTINGMINMADIDISRSGQLSSSNGIFGSNVPYIIIKRYVEKNPSSYAKNIGMIYEQTQVLKNVRGYTEINKIYVENFTGTNSEYSELLNLLKSGVIF